MALPLARSSGNIGANLQFPRKVAVLGSTGSIGSNTLAVCKQFPELFEVTAIAAGANQQKFIEQVREFNPYFACLSQYSNLQELEAQIRAVAPSCKLIGGSACLRELVAASSADVVVCAVVGLAGMEALLHSVKLGKIIALANKESVVCAGKLLSIELEQNPTAQIIPVDSEHSAIFQCMLATASCARTVEAAGQINGGTDLARITLTASGGPFLNLPLTELAKITPEQAVRHPNWSMGKKISIDSATMMNKALELIEAGWLFGLSEAEIDVVIHPQSIVHSLITFSDGTELAQLSRPDMRAPIAFAMSYPYRVPAAVVPKLSLTECARLDFLQVSDHRFPAIKLARQVLIEGRGLGAVLHCANEVAVEQFCQRGLSFDQIVPIVQEVVSSFSGADYTSLADLQLLCEESRKLTVKSIANRIS